MNYLKAECIKLVKTRVIWIMMLIMSFMFFLIFYQYTLNVKANVIEYALKDPVNLYSFFILIFISFLNIIFIVPIGSNLASKDYMYNTVQNQVILAGRYKLFIAKVIVLLLVSIVYILNITLLGFVFGLYHSSISEFLLMDLLKRLAIGIITTFLLGLFAMTIATLLKSSTMSNVCCLILFLGQGFFPDTVNKYLVYLNPYYYITVFTKDAFSNLHDLKFITFTTLCKLSKSKAIGCLVIFTLLCLIIQFYIYRKREYK